MSIDKARLWLDEHSDALPAFEHNIRCFNADDEQNPPPRLADFISTDLALSLALLKRVNANRGPDSGKDVVASAQSAISLLGEKVVRDLLEPTAIAEQQLTAQHQLFLYSQICNRGLHCQQQLMSWAKTIGYHQLDEFRLPALLYFSAEALCCSHDFPAYLEYVNAGSLPQSEVNFFGFSFKQLSETLCNQLVLPTLISQAQQLETSKSQQSQMLLHIATLCQLSEQGWYHSAMKPAFDTFSQVLQLAPEHVITQFHQNSVELARVSFLQRAWQPASRLPLIADSVWQPPSELKPIIKTTPETTKDSPVSGTAISQKSVIEKQPGTKTENNEEPVHHAINRIKLLLKQQDSNQSQVLHACLEGLASDLSIKRVGLFLLSRDKSTLQNRMAIGMEKNSPLRQLQLPIEQSGLFKILLKKPQAIHIFLDNHKKYAALIPARLQACSQTREFMAMSLFIGDKPVAVIYADQKGGSSSLEITDFRHFKQLVSFCSKALTFLQTKSS
jgi:hypothetical protein